MRKISLFLFTLVFTFSYCFCQVGSVIIIRGMIIDASSAEAISYANVSISGNKLSTMSNENGRFILKIPASNRNDSIHVSHIGYAPVTIAVNGSGTGFLSIKLMGNSEQLKEVVVKPINALDLVKKAIAQIPANYADTPFVLNVFYRVTGTKEKNVVDLSEAVFQEYAEDGNGKNRQVKLVRARLDQDLPAFGGMDGFEFGLRPKGIAKLDIVSRAGESGLLSDDGLGNHIFTYKGVVDYNGRDVYKISFEQKKGIKKSLDDGILYIDTSDLAFLQITMYKSPRGLKYWEFGLKQRMMLKVVNVHVNLLQDSGYITYRKYGHRYYPDHVYDVARWDIIGGRKHFELRPLNIKVNYLVTGIDTVNVTAFKKEESQINTKFLEDNAPDKNTDSTDAFWGNYNLIEAEFDVDSAAKIIRAHNDALSYKKKIGDILAKCKKDKDTRIDSILSFYYQKGEFNGAALVKYKGKLIYEKGFGLANKSKNILNTGKTGFRIGSTSKQFTALLIMQLVNENKISIDDTAGKFIPGFRNGKVTIQQLLTHQSGIPDYLSNEDYLQKLLVNKYSTDELVRQFCSDSPGFEPGTRFSYSNSGFIVLADIIEKVTGKRYSDVLDERIFTPLGMTHSYFSKRQPDTTYLATGYINDEPELAYPIVNEAGAGGITSTAEDLALWNNALSANTLLPKDKMNELFKPRVEWDEWGAYYGFGWMIDRLQFEVSKKHTVQYHPGTEVGFFDMLVRQPDKDIFIILLSNKSDFPRFDMTDLILNELN